jgi:hypothetical protein
MNRESGQSNNFITRLKTFGNSLRTQIISRFLTDPILKGIVILGSGTAVAQVLSIVFVPILTRIYPPAIYGTLALFSSLLSILVSV